MLAVICLKNALKVIPKKQSLNNNYRQINIFNYFIGFLKDKTCILITHQLQYLTSVEKIVLIENVKVDYNYYYWDIIQ